MRLSAALAVISDRRGLNSFADTSNPFCYVDPSPRKGDSTSRWLTALPGSVTQVRQKAILRANCQALLYLMTCSRRAGFASLPRITKIRRET